MNKKMMSAIQKLVLTDATFNGETVEPTLAEDPQPPPVL